MTQNAELVVRICPKCQKPAPHEEGVCRIGGEDYHPEHSPLRTVSDDLAWLIINGHIRPI